MPAPAPRRASRLAGAWLCALALCGPAASAIAGEIVRREILAVYDSRFEAEPSETATHRRLEMAANHLGFVLVYHDLRSPLPDPAAAARRYVGLLSWFTYDIERASAYYEWAAALAARGVKVVHLGGFGAPLTATHARAVNRLLAAIGVAIDPAYVDVSLGARVAMQDRTLVGYEREVDVVESGFPVIRAASADARPALVLEGPAIERGLRSVVVATGPGGGFALGGYELFYDAALNRSQWLIDPFAFLARALDQPRFPVPDTTTVSGRRLYFSHVDGDGWDSRSQASGRGGAPQSNAAILLRELVAPYPDLPVTIGFVAADGDPATGGGRQGAEIARRLFALPQVEVGSHTYTHPFEWRFFERYDAGAEKSRIAAAHTRERKAAVDHDHAHAAPRAYAQKPFDLTQEIAGALAVAQALAPAGKTAALYQWSGDALPFAAALDATRRAGVRNINGGDSRFDAQFPSVGYVAPLSRVVGGARQIYAVNSNENTYTDLWTDRFHGYGGLRETLARTETPRRLKGVNPYYHAYSAEKTASLKAVKALLDEARRAPLAPIEASHYAAIADGFFSAVVERLGASAWRISNRDGLQTVRFDDADALEVDPAASLGVVGETRLQGSLYVALDERVGAAEVALRPRRAARPADHASAMLAEARWRVAGLSRRACGLAFEARGYGRSEMTWSHVPPGLVRVRAARAGVSAWERMIEVKDDGRLAIDIDVPAYEWLDVRIGCDERAEGP